MTYKDKLITKTLIIGITLIPLTSLLIHLIYGSYLFSKWPWIRFSAVIATLTCLWTYTIWFFLLSEGREKLKYRRHEYPFIPVFFAFVVFPVDFFLLYPGPKALGIFSDSYAYNLLIVLGVFHGLGFYLIQRVILKYLYHLGMG